MPTLGRYTLLDRIGQGGMAEIWRARAEGPGGFAKTLAIKRVLPHLVEQASFIEMFVAEAKIVSELQHPNIVQVFDFGQAEDGNYFIAMEYVAGPNLASILKRLRDRGINRVPIELAFFIVAEVCKGLGYAHSRPDGAVIHRDISPHNVLISADGDVKVTDFGIAKVAGALGSTATGVVKGKLAYMSPEQVHQRDLDGRADLFSLGVVLWELLTGTTLFAGETVPEIAISITKYQRPPEEIMAELPEGVRTILGSALHRDPNGRYQTGATMEAAIAGVLGYEGMSEARNNLARLVKKLYGDELAADRPVLVSEDGATLATNSPVKVSGSGHTLISKRETGIPAATPPTKRKKRWPMVAAAGGAAALLAALGVWIAPKLLPQPAPTPTTVATAAPTATQTPNVTSLAAVTPTPRKTPRPRKTTRPITTRTTKPTTTPVVVAAKTGTLTVTARPWVEVWVDGKRVVKETPLLGYKLKAGPHTVRFVNTPHGYDVRKKIKVKPDGHLKLYVNAETKKIEVLRR